MSNLRAPQRREQLLACAIHCAADGRLYKMTLDDVADRADVSRALIIHYFRSMQGLRDAVVRKAIRDTNLPLLAQAVVSRDPLIKEAPRRLRQQAIEEAAR
jgi:AcrR family transcriptional regulator